MEHGYDGKAVAEHAHGVRQCCIMKYVVLLRVFDVVVMDEAATVGLPLSSLLGFVQVVQLLWQRRWRHRLPASIVVTLQSLGYTTGVVCCQSTRPMTTYKLESGD